LEAKERERNDSATSQERGEGRQVAHGGRDATQRRIACDADLDGGFRRDCRGSCGSGRDRGLRGFGAVYKGRESGGIGTVRAKRAREVELGLVSWPDTRWKTGLTAGPRLAVTRKRRPALSSAVAKGRGVQRWLSIWPRGGPCWRWAGLRERKWGKGGDRQAAGEKGVGPSPRQGGRREILFHFIFPAFTQTF